MNAFTTPRPVPWVKELNRNKRTSQIMQEIISNPTPTQVRELSLKTDFKKNAKRLQPTARGKS